MVVNHNSTHAQEHIKQENHSGIVSLLRHLIDAVRPAFKGAHFFKPQNTIYICCE